MVDPVSILVYSIGAYYVVVVGAITVSICKMGLSVSKLAGRTLYQLGEGVYRLVASSHDRELVDLYDDVLEMAELHPPPEDVDNEGDMGDWIKVERAPTATEMARTAITKLLERRVITLSEAEIKEAWKNKRVLLL